MLASLVLRGNIHCLAILEGIGGINDDAILLAYAAQNLQRGAKVAANSDRPQLHFVICSYDRNLRPFLTKKHGIDRHGDFLNVDLGREVDLAK